MCALCVLLFVFESIDPKVSTFVLFKLVIYWPKLNDSSLFIIFKQGFACAIYLFNERKRAESLM